MKKEKEDTKDLVKEFEKIKKEKMPKEDKIRIIKKIIISLLKGIFLVSLFIALNIAYSNMDKSRLENDIKIISGIVFIFSLITFEIAYKKDSGLKTISALELLVISFYILSTPYILNRFNLDIQTFFIISILISIIYYGIKTICIYKKLKKEYIKSNSDISDIIKKEEPTKKEALKRETIEVEEIKEKTINKKVKATKKSKPVKSNKKIDKKIDKKINNKPNKKIKEEKEALKEKDKDKDKDKTKTKTKTLNEDLEPKKKQTRKKASTKESKEDEEKIDINKDSSKIDTKKTTVKKSTTNTKAKVKVKDVTSKSTTTKKKKVKKDSEVEGEMND